MTFLKLHRYILTVLAAHPIMNTASIIARNIVVHIVWLVYHRRR